MISRSCVFIIIGSVSVSTSILRAIWIGTLSGIVTKSSAVVAYDIGSVRSVAWIVS